MGRVLKVCEQCKRRVSLPTQYGSSTSGLNKESLIYPVLERKRGREREREREKRIVGQELSGKVILHFCTEMIFSCNAIIIYLTPLLALLKLTAYLSHFPVVQRGHDS